MTIIALDVGTVRVGCSIGDEAVKIPFPHAVWQKASSKAEKECLKLIEEKQIKKIIIGLPLGINNELTEMCTTILTFARRIKARSTVEIYFIDETESSNEVKESDSRLNRNEKGDPIDAMAACIIMERYFNNEGIIGDNSLLFKD